MIRRSAFVLSLIGACNGGGGAAEGGSAGDTTSGDDATITSTTIDPSSTAGDSSSAASTTSATSSDPDDSGSSDDAASSESGSSDESSSGGDSGLECGIDLRCTGDTLWSRRFGNEDGTSSNETITAVAAMPDGGAVIGGSISGSAVFDDVATIADPPAAFVARLDAEGSVQWVQPLFGSDGIGIDDLGVDSAGNIVAYGGVLGDLDAAGELYDGSSFDWGVFLVGFAADGTPRWSSRHDSSWTVGGQLAIGPDDAIAIVGYFEGGIDFGGNLLGAVGQNSDMFVAVFESDGMHRWSRRFGDESYQYGSGVTFLASGDVIVGGIDHGRIDFGDGLLPEHPGAALVLAELAAADGEGTWAQQFVADDGALLGDPRLASDGTRIYLGTFAGSGVYASVDFGAGPAVGDFHVAAFDGDGTGLWARGFSDDDFGGEGIVGITASGTDGVVIGGYIQTPTDFGDGVVREAVGGDLFVAKYDADDGMTQWVRFEGDDDQGSVHQGTTDVAVAADGRVYAVGNFGGIIDFGDGDLVAGQGHGGWDGWVAALAP
ncbi:MAG TPA: hypothetical protein VG755_29545 [Nannocystaceae bacterium]|nr:hypothetical protein [Nannocystaceae bacterium]